MAAARRLLVVAALLLAGAAQAYYLPGTYPQEFYIGDVIPGQCDVCAAAAAACVAAAAALPARAGWYRPAITLRPPSPLCRRHPCS